MRCVPLLVILLLCNSVAISQSLEKTASDSAIVYWQQQDISLLRDTTLIRLYTRKANLTSNLDSSILYLTNGLSISLRLHSASWLAYSYNQIGLGYLRKGVSFKAMEYLYKGLQYAEMIREPQQQAFSWNYIGDCYANLRNYEKAIESKNKAIGLYEKIQNLPGLSASLNDLGAVLRENNRIDESIEVLEKCLKTQSSLQNTSLKIAIYHNLAATYLKKEDYAHAEKYGMLAMESEIGEKGRANAELLSLLSLIKSLNLEPEEALNYADRAGLYLNYEWPLIRERTALNLYLAYKTLQRPEQALEWHEKYLSLRENNAIEAQRKRIEIVRYEYDAQQRDAQIRGMTEEMVQQSNIRNGLLFFLIIFSLLAIMLFYGNTLLRKKRKELDSTNLKLYQIGKLLTETNATLEDRVQARTRELNELNQTLMLKNNEIQEALFQGQSIERRRVASELHNNLGSLLSGVKWRLESIDLDILPQAEQELYHSVVRLITDAYNQVRHISHNLLPSILEKEGLIPALEKLVKDLNRTGKANFEIINSSDAGIEDKKISFELYSCVLELINNILKHAYAKRVVLEFVLTEGFYILMLTDDGVGMGQTENTGIGLENIRQRIKSLQGSFSIYSLKNKRGTLITLRIPRQKKLVS